MQKISFFGLEAEEETLCLVLSPLCVCSKTAVRKLLHNVCVGDDDDVDVDDVDNDDDDVDDDDDDNDDDDDDVFIVLFVCLLCELCALRELL